MSFDDSCVVYVHHAGFDVHGVCDMSLSFGSPEGGVLVCVAHPFPTRRGNSCRDG